MLNLRSNNSSLLRTALLANAGFSILTALLILVLHDSVVEWLGAGPINLVSLGVSLLLFAGFLIWLARRPSIHPAIIIAVIIGDLLWVLGSLQLLLTNTLQFSTSGLIIIATVALFVLDFAIMQTIGLIKARKATALSS